MGKWRALDLFCGAGGAAMGLHQAGFDVVGIDNRPQPRYPFAFIQADALNPPVNLADFDFIWASPPCQGYSIMNNLPLVKNINHPLLINDTRRMLVASATVWAIENVMGAKLPAGYLCGGMFGLPFYRHRAFETSFFWLQPGHPPHRHSVRNGRHLGSRARDIVHDGMPEMKKRRGKGATADLVRKAFGIEWMTQAELTQAIPPAYSEYIGKAAIRYLETEGRHEKA